MTLRKKKTWGKKKNSSGKKTMNGKMCGFRAGSWPNGDVTGWVQEKTERR